MVEDTTRANATGRRAQEAVTLAGESAHPTIMQCPTVGQTLSSVNPGASASCGGPRDEAVVRLAYRAPSGPGPTVRVIPSSCSSLRILTPSSWALTNFDPASSPATT
jgi:hypothetical protein